jgi:hypothetical protein
LLYSAFILYGPDFGIIDDMRMLVSYVSGKPLPLFITPNDGRFAFLEGQEYILAALVSPTALCFFLFNALQIILAGFLLVAIGKLALVNKKSTLTYVFSALVMLTPGFMVAWLRLFVSERSEFLLISLFLVFFLKLNRTQNGWYALPCLAAAGTALCYKETAFILVGSFGFFHLCLNLKGTLKSRLLDISLIVLPAIYLFTYYVLVYRFRGEHLYSESSVGIVQALTHTLGSNVLHDPWIILCLVILIVTRAQQFTCQKNVEPVFDSMLLSSLCFYVAYLALRMSNIYYLLPLYVFVPYVGCKVLSTDSLRRPFRPAVLVLLIGMFISQELSGMREVLTWKFAPANFQAVLKAISVQHPGPDGKLNIFLCGSNRGSGIELYSNLAKYLTYVGLKPYQFDIKSDAPIDDLHPYTNTLKVTPKCPYSYCKATEIDRPSQGDYVLLTPYDSVYERSAYKDPIHYQLIFRTVVPIVPNLSLKDLAGHILTYKMRHAANNRIDTNFYLYKVL